MRYLWISSFAITVAGVVLTAGGMTGFLDTIAIVCGLLLLWTGIVKIIVLRIWQRSLTSPSPMPIETSAEKMDQVARRAR